MNLRYFECGNSKGLSAWPFRLAALAAVVTVAGAGTIEASAQCCSSAKATATKAAECEMAFDAKSLQVAESRANTFSHSLQNRACLATDADGRILVVWDSRRQENMSYGVVGQLFDALGRKVGTEFRVNDYAPSIQHEASVAFDTQNRAWAVWQSEGQDGDSSGIFMRRFGDLQDGGAFGALTDEIRVNLTTDRAQTDPSISINGDGTALVTWTNQLEDGTVQAVARLFDADGNAVTNEVLLGSHESGSDRMVASAVQPDGSFMTVWDRIDANGDPEGIYARPIAADGSITQPASLVSITQPGSQQIEPSIDIDTDGRCLVAWMSKAADADGYDVLTRTLNADGSPQGDPQIVSAYAGSWQSGAAVAWSGNGRYLVSYNVFGEMEADTLMQRRPQPPSTMMARVYNADGTPSGDAFQVNVGDSGQHALAAASNAQRVDWGSLDHLAFAWDGQVDGDRTGIGLTVLAPADLDLPAPSVVEQIAAGSELTAADVRVPPVPTENWRPQEKELFPAEVGPDFGFIGYTTTEWQPPDPDLAVGPEHIVGVVNMRIAIYDKNGTELFHDYLENFWGGLGADYFVFDPVAQYDPHADRFVVASAEHQGGNANLSYLDVAVSMTSNPMDGWHKYRFSLSSIGAFVDFENLAIGTDAYYITADYFGGGGNNIHIFDKSKMLNGDPVTMKHVTTGGSLISLGAADNWDTAAPAQYFGTSYSGSSTRLKLYAVEDPLGTPNLSSYNLTVPRFDHPPSAAQKGSSNRLSTVDFRIKHGVYRNGNLWLAHAIGENSTARVRWYEIKMNGWPSSGSNPSLTQSGTFDLGSGQHSWFQDISVTDDGDAVIAANRSSSNDYPFISRFVRKNGDATGTFREEVRLMESNGAHTGGRWGDYAGVDADPADPGVFWSHHEYNEGTGTNWRTWVGRFDADQSMVLSVTDLHRGQQATFTVNGAKPFGTVYIVYSLAGTGSTYVPSLDVTLGLQNPKLSGSTSANSSGVAVYQRTVPNSAPLVDAWVQAAESNNSSNVVKKTILN
ncbi:MAG: hypothetical protein D8M59_00315 [Planctomycetes bacterium]|nr:hypothetical protein [Planctomycetota bacterium]NOG54837.1 hypothetical protein [Planctomycetota bacterium]